MTAANDTVSAKFAAAMQSVGTAPLLVALSGGADSVCLLDLAIGYAKAVGVPVCAAHLNHALRGKEADRDEAFCRELCARLRVPLSVETADVAGYAAAHSLGIEEAAREVRYAFLARVCPANGRILTAHHQNDLGETMLLHLTRGSGLRGLCSIPAVRGNIVRPLLGVSKAEILAYNAAHGLAFVTDSTNADISFARNRIRKNVLPELCAISPAAVRNMARTAALLAQDEDCLSGMAKAFLETQTDGFDTKAAQNLHPSILSRALQMLYTESGFSDLGEVHLHALCAQIYAQKQDFTLALPASFALAAHGKLTFVEKLPAGSPTFEIPLAWDLPVTLPDGRRLLLCGSPPSAGANKVFPIATEALFGKLTVTSRREGDTVTALGKTHKVKRMIADRKLTAMEKNRLFFLRRDGEILFSDLPLYADESFPRPGMPASYICLL